MVKDKEIMKAYQRYLDDGGEDNDFEAFARWLMVVESDLAQRMLGIQCSRALYQIRNAALGRDA